jgi:hypothetical protein
VKVIFGSDFVPIVVDHIFVAANFKYPFDCGRSPTNIRNIGGSTVVCPSRASATFDESSIVQIILNPLFEEFEQPLSLLSFTSLVFLESTRYS